MTALENLLSQEIIQKLGWTLLHFIWQAAAVAFILTILLRLLRKSTANVRYIIACLALVLIVLLPVITIQLVPVSAIRSTAFQAVNTGRMPVPPPTVEMPAAETIILEEPVKPEIVTPASSIPFKQRAIETLEPALPYIVSGWLLGVFGLSLWHLGGWAQLQRLKRRMVKQVDDTLHSKLSRLAQRLRVKQTVQLMESALVQIPTVVGWLRPVILLPASALTGLSAEQLEAILAHELAHIRRHDYLVNIMQTVVEILGFYHPAVWWVSHKIRAERENCCDDLAVSISGDRVCYARALTSMEEIRAGRGQLAVAASGGNLFRRIRRLVSKDSTDKTRFSWVPAATVILLIIALLIPTTLALTTGRTDDPSDTNLETILLDGFRENRSKFKCGVLAWTRKTINDGFSGPVKDKYETEGSFQLWWDGNKIATKYVDERVCSGTGRRWWIEVQTGGNAYDGSLLSRKAKFRLYENWFDEVICWTGPLPLDKDIATMKKLKHVSLDWSIIEEEGKQIKLSVKNLKDGASGVRYFDLLRGCNQVRRESYNAQGRLYSQQTRKLQQVNGGGWFPVEVDMMAINREGKVTLHHRFVLDLSRCSFNEPSAIPEGIFKFSTTKEQEQLNKILEKYSGGKTADENNENVKSVCESVENYISAALAGEDEKAAAYTYPGSAVVQQTDDTREVLQGQQVQILAVCSGDWNALTTISVILGDHGRIGPVIFHLKKVILEQKVHWLIDDIDLETLDTVENEIERFFERNPKAKTVLFKPQRPVVSAKPPTTPKTDVQVEGGLAWGEAVEGVHVRVRLERQRWYEGETPKFLVDMRNNGTVELELGLTQEHWEVELDGLWYRVGASFTGWFQTLLFAPGQEHRDILFYPGVWSRWNIHGKPLKFTPGLHTVRLSFVPNTRDRAYWRRVVSNAVVIEVLPAEADKRGWGNVVAGLQCGLRADKRLWKADEAPRLQAVARNIGGSPWRLPPPLELFFLKVAGKIWRWRGPVSGKGINLKPGEDLDKTTILLSEDWGPPYTSDLRLKLSPGKHTVQLVMFVSDPVPPEALPGTIPIPKQLPIESNVVAIEVLPAEKTDVRVKGKVAMEQQVYDISDLVVTAADANDLIRRITTTIEPDSWYKLSDTGEGTIIAYPIRQPKKFAVLQTRKIHQKIKHFLEDMRSSRDELPEPNLPLTPEVPLITNTFIESDLITVLQDIASMAGIVIIPDENVVGLVTAELKDVPLEKALDIVLAGTPYLVKKTPYYYLVASAVELVEIEKRFESAKKLSNLGKALLIYANDHDDKYPDSLHELRGYLKTEDFAWTWQNVEYMARGKTISDRPDTVIAYDKKLLVERKGTNVLFNDSHVDFVKPERLKDLGIGATAILIDTKILSVSEDFLKDIGLDANSISSSNTWSEHLVADSAAEPNDETYSLIIDDLHVSFLLKAVQAHQGSKMSASPRALTREGTTATMAILTEEYYVLGYTEPNRPSDEPEPKKDKVEIGTRFWVKPELTSDNEKIKLDFKLEFRQLLGYEERKYKGKYIYIVPLTEVVSTQTQLVVPDGKTLLIGGLKITEQAEIQSSVPILGKLPLVGKAFRSRSIIKDHKMLLILLKPVINPQQKASKILPGQEDSEEHIKNLGRLLERKLNRYQAKIDSK